MVRYDDHAGFQLARRGIDKAWVEQISNDPDLIENTSGAHPAWDVLKAVV